MKIKSFLKVLSAVVFVSFIFGSCSKSTNPTPNNPSSSFKPSDFKISNIVPTIYDGSVFIDFDETNTTSKNYDYTKDGGFTIKMKIKTTDGAQYQTDQSLALTLDAGNVATETVLINYTSGKTIDPATIEYTVTKD